jgi:hypothetical protein
MPPRWLMPSAPSVAGPCPWPSRGYTDGGGKTGETSVTRARPPPFVPQLHRRKGRSVRKGPPEAEGGGRASEIDINCNQDEVIDSATIDRPARLAASRGFGRIRDRISGMWAQRRSPGCRSRGTRSGPWINLRRTVESSRHAPWRCRGKRDRAAHVVLDRVTSHRLGESDSRSSVAPVADAEDAVIDEWAELHDDLLGYPPTW